VVPPKLNSKSVMPSVNVVSPDAPCARTDCVLLIRFDSTKMAATADIDAPESTIVSIALALTLAVRERAKVVRRLTFLVLLLNYSSASKVLGGS